MRRIARLWCSAIVFGLLLATPALADPPHIAQVKTLSGDAFIVRGADKLPAKIGDFLFESDVIQTGAGSTIGLTFIDNTVFSAGPGSEVALQQFHFDTSDFKGDMQAEVRKGTLTVVSGEITHTTPGAMKIRTPTANLAVRGTTFAVKVY